MFTRTLFRSLRKLGVIIVQKERSILAHDILLAEKSFIALTFANDFFFSVSSNFHLFLISYALITHTSLFFNILIYVSHFKKYLSAEQTKTLLPIMRILFLFTFPCSTSKYCSLLYFFFMLDLYFFSDTCMGSLSPFILIVILFIFCISAAGYCCGHQGEVSLGYRKKYHQRFICTRHVLILNHID